MIGPVCYGCGLSFYQEEIQTVKKGELEFELCDFCRTSFVSNAIMYPTTKVSNAQVIRTIARSHNLIMKELKRRK